MKLTTDNGENVFDKQTNINLTIIDTVERQGYFFPIEPNIDS